MSSIRILKDGSISHIDNINTILHYNMYDVMSQFNKFVIAGDKQFIVPYDSRSWIP